jgi:asparagine synthetase B (glutamine-hydrolysing)
LRSPSGDARNQATSGKGSGRQETLFYFYNGSKIAFASELKAILKSRGAARDRIRRRSRDYFSFLYVPAPKSIFKNIRKVLPGHYLAASKDGIQETGILDLSFNCSRNISRMNSGAIGCSKPIKTPCAYV